MHIKRVVLLKLLQKIQYNTLTNNINQSHSLSLSPHEVNMCSNPNLIKPPECVKNMQILDKCKFTKPITLPCVNVGDTKVSDVLPHLKKYLLKMDTFKPVVNEDNITYIILNPVKISTWDDIEEPDRAKLNSKGITADNLSTRSDHLKYENFSVEEVFRSVLPDDVEGMASFTKIGHVVHINLREHLLPYKKLIGDVLLEKVSGCKTVVNKVDMIDNTYRNFKMEVLSGTEDFNVALKENKCRFEFDFSKVYWNSRLCTEHERIVDLIQPSDVLFDVFAGVGPFSVPIAKKRCIVYANDLNPESYKWLKHNAKINKVGDNLHMHNLDGHDFIRNVLKAELLRHISEHPVHIVMNLPGLATEFLKAFCGLYEPSEFPETIKPAALYVYCFAKGEDYDAIARDAVIKGFGSDVRDKITDVFRVRTVSSMKEMMRVTVKLDRDILVGLKRKAGEDSGSAKRCSSDSIK